MTWVWDVERGVMIEVTPAEAAAGVQRYARSLGAGTAACGEWERRAFEIARDDQLCSGGREPIARGAQAAEDADGWVYCLEHAEAIQRTCDDCGAAPGEPCSWSCSSHWDAP